MNLSAFLLPIYAYSIVVGAATIGCIFGSNFLNKKQLAALAGAMSLLQANFKRYREEVNSSFINTTGILNICIKANRLLIINGESVTIVFDSCK